VSAEHPRAPRPRLAAALNHSRRSIYYYKFTQRHILLSKKHSALLNVHISFRCLYKIYIIIIFKILISIFRYFVKYCIDFVSKLKWYRVITTIDSSVSPWLHIAAIWLGAVVHVIWYGCRESFCNFDAMNCLNLFLSYLYANSLRLTNLRRRVWYASYIWVICVAEVCEVC